MVEDAVVVGRSLVEGDPAVEVLYVAYVRYKRGTNATSKQNSGSGGEVRFTALTDGRRQPPCPLSVLFRMAQSRLGW
jgi:hypothetical protein